MKFKNQNNFIIQLQQELYRKNDRNYLRSITLYDNIIASHLSVICKKFKSNDTLKILQLHYNLCIQLKIDINILSSLKDIVYYLSIVNINK